MKFWKFGAKDMVIEDTHLWKQYAGFLRAFSFSFVASTRTTKERLPYLIEVFQNEDLMLASSVRVQDGWMIFVAPLGSTTDPDAIVDRVGGWRLISEVWIDYCAKYAAAQDRFPYPYEVPESERLQIFDETLREFMEMVREGKLSVSHPTHRLEDDPGSAAN